MKQFIWIPIPLLYLSFQFSIFQKSSVIKKLANNLSLCSQILKYIYYSHSCQYSFLQNLRINKTCKECIYSNSNVQFLIIIIINNQTSIFLFTKFRPTPTNLYFYSTHHPLPLPSFPSPTPSKELSPPIVSPDNSTSMAEFLQA